MRLSMALLMLGWLVMSPCPERDSYSVNGNCYAPQWSAVESKSLIQAQHEAGNGDLLLNTDTGVLYRVEKTEKVNLKKVAP